MSDIADAVREAVTDNPVTLVINGDEITGYAGPVATVPGADGESRSHAVEIGYIGEPPNEETQVGYQGSNWTVSDFDIFDNAVTATIQSNG